jgi:predicted N-acetyltransferase YhbS
MKEQRLYSNNNIIYEEATKRDINRIVSLIAAGNIQTNVNVTPELTKEVIHQYIKSKKFIRKKRRMVRRGIRSKRALVLVARDGDEIIGYAEAKITGHWRKKHSNKGNYISHERQGEGIGTELTQRRINWHGKVDIYTTTVPGTLAERFLTKFGFEQIGKERTVPYANGRRLPVIDMKLAAQNQHLANRKTGN